MSTLPTGLDQVIVPRARDLGGFEVRRALPAASRQMVGPFIFFDQMGPAEFLTGAGVDVRPHPHIGLATVTYLLEGAIVHRDSLGTELEIRPGDVNWMTAGRGIVHSERTGPALRVAGSRLFGIQSWVALPAEREEADPGFTHVGSADLPVLSSEGKRVRVIAGRAYGVAAPTPTLSDTLYADVALDAGAILPVDTDHEDRAIYVLEGEIEIAGDRFGAMQMLVLRPGDRLTVSALSAARLLLLGGATLEGPRHIWWNFVSSRKERIDQAKADWLAGRFQAVPGETEFIPLPG
ncbi:pirin family protein [Prosthecomicrobium sp. N25]|uniref:pirin family protein n=1 Tax=Prosthecomicrobium sp. N25 TaxID=3129254 RepID=UPI0030783BCD